MANIHLVNELFVPGVETIWNIGNMLIYIAALSLIGGADPHVGTVIAFINYIGTLGPSESAFHDSAAVTSVSTTSRGV